MTGFGLESQLELTAVNKSAADTPLCFYVLGAFRKAITDRPKTLWKTRPSFPPGSRAAGGPGDRWPAMGWSPSWNVTAVNNLYTVISHK